MVKPPSFALIFPSLSSSPSSTNTATPVSHAISLSLSLWGFFSLLDGAEAEPQTNFSHSRNEAWRAQFVSLRGNRIHSSVPQKTPFLRRERELFVWWQLQLSTRSSCDSFKSCAPGSVHVAKWTAVCHHSRWFLVFLFFRTQQSNCTLSAFLTKLPNNSKSSV